MPVGENFLKPTGFFARQGNNGDFRRPDNMSNNIPDDKFDLFLKGLMDDVRIEQSDDGTRVTMVKYNKASQS